jgi:hypothetical protein
MGYTNLTGGQESMQKIIVETARPSAERLNVFRTSPFEFEVTAPTLAATAVVGRPTLAAAGPRDSRAETWPTTLSTASFSQRG